MEHTCWTHPNATHWEDRPYIAKHNLAEVFDGLLQQLLATKPPNPAGLVRQAYTTPSGGLPAHCVYEHDGAYWQMTYFSHHSAPLNARTNALLAAVEGFDPKYSVVHGEQSYSLQEKIPAELRLGVTFLDQLGRDPAQRHEVKSGHTHFDFADQRGSAVPGLPEIKLTRPFKHLSPHETVRISSQTIHQAVTTTHGTTRLAHALRQLGLTDVSQLYGSEEFTVSVGELQQFERNTRVYLGDPLPPVFCAGLLSILSNTELNPDVKAEPPTNLQYYWERKGTILQQLRDMEPDSELAHFLRAVDTSPAQYGFRSTDHFHDTLQSSQTELSTSICVGQDGYFFGGWGNQLKPKPQLPIHFLSAAGVDFCSGVAAKREMEKYFVRDRFKPGGRDSMKARIKATYSMLYRSCERSGVTHPCFLPMGLGVFLPSVQTVEVKKLYHEAQFELLSEQSYGFEVYFLNPGPARAEAIALLETQHYNLRCPVVLHDRNVKFLAVECATRGHKPSFLNPSDHIAVMQGRMGYWWEVGYGLRFVGEEDFGATSTGLLGHIEFTDVFTDPQRLVGWQPFS
eukprot:NODE_728_length_1912_cov_21.293557_g675_i0.p1 GENE.NODE_728_length_1912_cov_21.293557_g675_i0~~NODE_728_length_1912_cov_21.293557_g675_i0.p1  ORF type:complete len:568 (+),score=146.72 NODE_728_length_1912_cov_21.293557_g675_i0:52-1755(+)